MARASRIYLVVWHDYEGVDVRAAFTVKHELITWLRRCPERDLTGCSVLSYPDGREGATTTFEIKELIA